MWLDYPTDVQDNGEALKYLETYSLRITGQTRGLKWNAEERPP